MTNKKHERRWEIALLSVFAPGLGQWANHQLSKAFVFLLLHCCGLIWLWIPLLTIYDFSGNRRLFIIGMLALWTLSVIDAFIHSGRHSVFPFKGFSVRFLVRRIAIIILLSSIAAIDLKIPHLIKDNHTVTLLTPTIPIAAALVFEPITGGIVGVLGILLSLIMHLSKFPTILFHSLAILATCGLASIIRKKNIYLAGLTVLVPNLVDASLWNVQSNMAASVGYHLFCLAILERVIIHWIGIIGIRRILSIFKKWYFNQKISNNATFKNKHTSFRKKTENYQNQVLNHNPPNHKPKALVNEVKRFSEAKLRSFANLPSSVNPISEQLWSEMLDIANLTNAFKRVQANHGAPGPDGVTVEDFALNTAGNIDALRRLLLSGQYEPLPPKKFEVKKSSGGLRQLSIFTVRDRIVQQALLQILIPFFEPHFLPCSFAYRPGLSAHQALKRVDQHIKEGNHWILDGDIESFFDTVRHDILLQLIQEKVKDASILGLIKNLIAVSAQSNNISIPQGSPISPLFANIYLTVFDNLMIKDNYHLTRYADDFVVLTQTTEMAEAALETAQWVLLEKLCLRMSQEKTRICHLREGFVFLGYHFTLSGRRPSERAMENLQTKVQEKITASMNSGSEKNVEAIQRLRSTLVGWCNYFGVEVSQLLGEKNDSNDLIQKEFISETKVNPPESQGLIMTPSQKTGYSSEEISQFLTIFSGRENVYARQWVHSSGKCGYVPIRQPLSEEVVCSHLLGDTTLALYLIKEDNTVSLMVIDVDSKTGQSAEIDETHEMALRIKDVGRSVGLPVYLEESGRKGRHCWIFFAGPVEAKDARQLGRLLVAKAGQASKGIRGEVFPKQERVSPNALGSLIKLPLGVHQITRRRCLFLEDDGSPIKNQGAFLHKIRRISPDVVETAIKKLSGKFVDLDEKGKENAPLPEKVQKLLDGCNVLRYLVDRAKETKHLNHSERLVLLYTFGHLGEEGQIFIHRVISQCENYNPNITQKWINRLEPGRPPISCARIRDWLYDIIPIIGCACKKELSSLGRYPSPVLYALPDEKEPDERMTPDEGGKATQISAQEIDFPQPDDDMPSLYPEEEHLSEAIHEVIAERSEQNEITEDEQSGENIDEPLVLDELWREMEDEIFAKEEENDFVEDEDI